MSDSDGPDPVERGAAGWSPFGFPLSSWKRTAGEGAWAMAGQIAAGLAGLVAIRLLTELAPKEVFGEASLVLGAMMLGRHLFLAPVMNSQIRFHPEYRAKGQARWFSGEIAGLARIAAGAFAVAGTCAYLTWRGLSGGGLRPFLALALAGILVTDVAKSLRRNRLNAERRQGRFALWVGAEAWLWPALSALGLVLWCSTEMYLAGQAAGSAVALALFGMILYPRAPPDSEVVGESRRPFVRKVLAYGLPFVPLALVGWAANLGDRYILAGFMSKADVGLYVAAYSVASRPFVMAGGVFSTFARPVLFEAESSGQQGKARKVFALWMLAVACVGALGVLLFWLSGDLVARLLLAEEYRAGASAILFWVASAHAVYSIAQVLENRLLSFGRSGSLLLPAVLGAAGNMLSALLLVSDMGILGVARAKVIARALQFLAAVWSLRTGTRRSQVGGAGRS